MICAIILLLWRSPYRLTTDNNYTTVALANHMFEKYGWTIVATIVPTDKLTQTDEDFPFLKLL
jgi:hypothetical protein